jgi:hypothetical protein
VQRAIIPRTRAVDIAQSGEIDRTATTDDVGTVSWNSWAPGQHLCRTMPKAQMSARRSTDFRACSGDI